jgi:membrane protein insertase Oxa1/YidC/SpoIIIJ
MKRCSLLLYWMFGDFMSVLQDLIAEVTPSHKCHMNMGLTFNSYRAHFQHNVAPPHFRRHTDGVAE